MNLSLPWGLAILNFGTNLASRTISKHHQPYITLPTKVCLVKAKAFPVVMYGCESWTVKKAEDRKSVV